jgi:hypothetical protein
VIRLPESDDVGRALPHAVFAIVAAVILWRAVGLGSGEPVLTARSEREFLAWSYRDPDLHRKLERAAARLRPNEVVSIEVAPGEYDPDWLLVMARYYFSGQQIRPPMESRASDGASVTRILIRPNGPIRIIRPPRRPAS